MKTFNDTIQFNEALINFNGGNVLTASFSDSISRNDTIQKKTVKIFSDIIDLLDASSKNYIRSFTDYMFKSDLTPTKKIIKTLNDTFTKTDEVRKSIIRTYSDTFSKSESLTKKSTKNISDTITKTESFSRLVAFKRTYTDELIKTEKLKRYLNGVEQIWTKITHTLSTTWEKRTKPTTNWSKRDKPNDTIWQKISRPWRP